MKLLKHIKSRFNKTISVEDFAESLSESFRRMREHNIETLGKFTNSIKKMNEDQLMKLDWELSILDMFITTYCCRLHLTDELICDQVLDAFHKSTFHDFSEIDKMLAYTFQEESKIKYQAYFDALRSEKSCFSLCKILGENIFDKEINDAITLNTLTQVHGFCHDFGSLLGFAKTHIM